MKKKLSDRQLWERTITENDILGAIRSFLELHGARVFRVVERIPWGKQTSEKGIPDLFGWWPIKNQRWPELETRLVNFFIEVKKPGAHRRPAQLDWIRAAQDDGVIAFFAESVEDVIREFKHRGVNL